MTLHRMATDWLPSPKPIPAGQMLFAVGDIHGYVSHLRALRQLIGEVASGRQDVTSTIVYLGDYIDRGPDSLGVLKFLAEDWRSPIVPSVYLYGNHDTFLTGLLAMEDEPDPDALVENLYMWLVNGGVQAVRSFHIELGEEIEDLVLFRDLVAQALGPEVLAFLSQLKLYHQIGDYVFVHAGVHPKYPLESQGPDDLIWIRNAFLDAGPNWRHPFCVVHGHTPACPEVLPHRIGVDTGVYMGQALSAVQMVDDKVRFLTVAESPDGSWQESIYARYNPVAYFPLPPG